MIVAWKAGKEFFKETRWMGKRSTINLGAVRNANRANQGNMRREDIEEMIAQRINEAASRRLEAATGGHLTFDGDQVIATDPLTPRP